MSQTFPNFNYINIPVINIPFIKIIIINILNPNIYIIIFNINFILLEDINTVFGVFII